MDKLVSVIIPCYNSAKYISETILNILNQSYTNLECILVDDGSTDETCAILDQFVKTDKRVRYYCQENGGSGQARNTGLQHAKGDYIQFIDSDDFIHPEKLKIQVKYLDEHPEIEIVYGQVDFFSDTELPDFETVSELSNNLVKKLEGCRHQILSYLVEDNIMAIHAPLIRQKVYEDVGLFDPKFKSCEDYDYWFRAALAGAHFIYLNEPLTTAYYRKHVTNKSSSFSRMGYYCSLVFQKHTKVIKEQFTDLWPAFSRRFMINHKKYLFGKKNKSFSDIIYTFRLTLKLSNLLLVCVIFQYLLVPNRVWSTIYWNGGFRAYLKNKMQK